MKAYVIVTLNLCAMHGANMFIYNKVQYLKNHGWKVFVFSAEQGEILIPGLREYQNDQISTIRFYPACFSQKQIGRVLDQIEQRVREAGCDEVMVESTNLISALWGELIAQRLGGKNMAYILQERFGVTSEMKKFLRFKLSRHELAGIAKESVSKMLGDPELPFDDSMHIVAYCTNSIDICEDTVTPQLNPDADLTFGSIGRLEKLFVHPMIQQLQAYFLQHSDQTFNLVMLGGTRAQKCYQQIRDAMEPCKNVTLVFTGYIFPIPKSFVDRCDLFLSAAGSAIATYHMRRPTIEMNPTTGDIIGALGLTCGVLDHDVYTSNYPITELGSFIDQALEKKDAFQYTNAVSGDEYREWMFAELDRQLRLAELCDTAEYYDVSGIKFERAAYRPFNVMGKVLSPDALYRLLELARKIIK